MNRSWRGTAFWKKTKSVVYSPVADLLSRQMADRLNSEGIME